MKALWLARRRVAAGEFPVANEGSAPALNELTAPSCRCANRR